MAIETSKLKLKRSVYQDFMKQWGAGNFQGQRLGLAFYEHFRFERLTNQSQLHGLKELDGEAAKAVISRVFRFT